MVTPPFRAYALLDGDGIIVGIVQVYSTLDDVTVKFHARRFQLDAESKYYEHAEPEYVDAHVHDATELDNYLRTIPL